MKPRTVLERAKKLFGPKGENWVTGIWVRENNDGPNPKLNYCLTGAIGAAVMPRKEGETVSRWNSRVADEMNHPRESRVAICALAESIEGEDPGTYDPDDDEDFSVAWDTVVGHNDTSEEYREIEELLEEALKKLS